MRRSTRTRGNGRSQNARSVSLFPFLAVLICTVGALVLLLVVISRQARVEAARMASDKKTESEKHLREDGEDVRWRIGHLQAALDTTQEKLTEARLNLGHVEDHARELRRHLARLKDTVKHLDDASGDLAENAALRRQLDEVAAKIEETKARVARARRDATSRGRSYAIIPYEGPHGTRRRPIYIECRADAIVLHPEEMIFQPADFEGSPGPANPLAVALRATREYMLEMGRLDPAKSGEPYPLLLVRPTGVHSYYAAREAMSSWESDFGYELIDEDWELHFDPPDPKLAQLLTQEIARARLHMEQLAKAAPRHFERVRGQVRGERTEYTVSSTTGVVVPYRGAPIDDRPRRPRWTGGVSGSQSFNPDGDENAGTGDGIAAGTRTGSDNVADTRQTVNAETGMRTGAGPGAGAGTGAGSIADGGTGNDTARSAFNGTGNGSSLPLTHGPGPYSGANLAGDSTGNTTEQSAELTPDMRDGPVETATSPLLANPLANPLGSPLGSLSGNAPAGATGVSPYSNPGPATPNNQFDPTGGVACPTTTAGQVGSPGGQRPSEASSASTSPASANAWGQQNDSTNAASSASTQSPPRLGEWNPPGPNAGTPGAPTASVPVSSRRPPKSIAEKRGADWALPEVAPQSTPLTKPIRIECYPDRLVLVAERGLTGGREVALGPRTEDSMDEFVSAVWDYAESWGIAGRGMYWRPHLHVYVAPGAETRYHDLQALLRDSGLPIQWKI